MGCFSSADVRRLLHNKYVAVLGDSIQRSVYKDLVKLLQNDAFLSDNQLRKKGEMTFANDTLVEGGSHGEMHNGITYREVRQYRTGHHLMRFYFLTRAYSEYVESVLADFKKGPKPDVVIVNSCIWDLIRYTYQPLESYKKNLDCLFIRLTEVLSPECLVIWNMTMPVGFRASEMPQFTKHNLRWDIVEGNFYSATLANFHKMDVLDMHYHFRFDLRSRCKDAVHWNQLAHRKYSQILLAHIAQAWGVEPPEGYKIKKTFIPGPMRFHPNQMRSNAVSPFVEDTPFFVNDFPPRNVDFDGFDRVMNVNFTVPMFDNHPFSSMTINTYHMAVPGEFGTFHYNAPIPRGAWRGHRRVHRRRDGNPIHPYHRPPPYSSRI